MTKVRSRKRLNPAGVPQLRLDALLGGSEAARKEEAAGPSNEGEAGDAPTKRWMECDGRNVYLGSQRLDEYLRSAKVLAPLAMERFLQGLDWSAFEARYKGGGRPGYPPSRMVGLLVYGFSRGVCSLRDLESFARTDLGCLWIAGGACPDHASIGNFLTLHSASLSGEFFEQLTARVLKDLGARANDLDVDGTTVQAAGSRYRRLSAEVAAERAKRHEQAAAEAEAAAKQAKAAATQPMAEAGHEERTSKTTCREEVLAKRANAKAKKARAKATLARQAAQTAQQRTDARRAAGKSADSVAVCPSEPEAVIQKLKTGAFAPSYKPSIAVNADRIICGKGFHGSNETTVVESMVEQAERMTGDTVTRIVADAGYHNEEMIKLSLARDIDLLSPEGSMQNPDGRKQSEKYFPKGRFVYDEKSDTYRCPANRTLSPQHTYAGTDTHEAYTRYGTRDCRRCPLKTQCTKADDGRLIKRYASDDAKDALNEVMKSPGAKARYAKRQANVEPVFASLRGRQNFNRFLRRGTAGAELEFSLHAAAHNMGRLLAIEARRARARRLRTTRELRRRALLASITRRANGETPFFLRKFPRLQRDPRRSGAITFRSLGLGRSR